MKEYLKLFSKSDIEKTLAKKFLVRILLVSSLITLFLTSFQLSKDYFDDYSFLLHKIDEIESSNLKSLAQSVWVLNKEQINLQLEGLVKIPDIEYVELKIDIGEVYSKGNADQVQNKMVKKFPIFNNIDGVETYLGELSVVASKDKMMSRLREKSVIILLSQATKTFFVSIFILIIFYQLIGKHLSKISEYTSSLNFETMGDALKLYRKDNKISEQDELDTIVDSVNNMRLRLIDDLMKREEFQRALLESDKKLVAISNNIPGVVFQFKFIEKVLTITHISFSKQNIFQFDKQEYFKKPESLLSVLNIHDYDEVNERVLLTGKEEEFSIDISLNRGGADLWGQVNINVTKEDDKSVLWTGILLDKTQTKLEENKRIVLEEQLAQSQKMEALGTLAGGIAHDFNNILQGIYNALSIVNLEKLDDDSRDGIQNIENFSQRGKDLIRKILIFSRKDQSKVEVIELVAAIEEVTNMLKAMIPASHAVVYKHDIGTCNIKADKTQVNQILFNLCINASHALKDRGKIVIDLKRSVSKELLAEGQNVNDYIQLDVSDNGHGMSKDVQDRIFEPFFTTKESTKGSGLGMSVVHGVITNLGGTIKVSSKEGEGTTFSILLPLHKGDVQQVAKQEVIEPEKTKLNNVLILDDEKESLFLCGKVLKKNGYNVSEFFNAKNALDFVLSDQGENIDLVITDLTMPEMSGVDFASEIRSKFPEKPIILMTGYLDENVNEHELFDRTLIKPFSGKELIEVIDEFEIS